jgi:hypothetical protein
MRTPAKSELQDSPAMSGPLYDLLLVGHVVVAVVGFGAVAVSGRMASSAYRTADPAGDPRVLRFFREGPDWPARAIFLVPVLGLALLFGGDRSDVHAAWPWIGLAIWVGVAGLATAWCWPAEQAAQAALARLVSLRDVASLRDGASLRDEASLGRPLAERDGEAVRGALPEFLAACRSLERASGVISVCFVLAVAVMIIQP